MNLDLSFYWKLLLRRLPFMAALFLICAGIGAALAIKLPERYASSARLLVERQEIPGNLASSTVQIGAREQIAIIRQQMMTRANLIDMANRLEVFPNIRQMNPDDVALEMRRNVRMSARGRPLIVQVGFRSENRETAVKVANELVSQVLELNAELRSGIAGGTLDFFEQEVARLNNELAVQSENIMRFRTDNADALPGTLNFRQGQLTRNQQNINRFEREIDNLTTERERLVEMFATTGSIRSTADQPQSPEERQLANLQRQLDNALLIYSSTNPRVRIIQSRIDQVEEAILAKQANVDPDAEGDRQRALFDVRINEIDSRIEVLRNSIAQAEAEIEGLEASIQVTPANAVALAALERDMQAIRSQFNQASQSLAKAQLGERIELSTKAQRITVLEPPRRPQEPFTPNRPAVAGTGAMVGLGLALGLFVFLELVNRSVRRPAELTGRLGIEPLMTIPYIESRGRRIARRSLRVLITLAVIIGIPAALWAIDTYYQPLEILSRRVLEALNLDLALF